MRKFWLMDQHDGDGPTALVETDGRLKVVDILRFGPSITDLAAQQQVWDDVIGRVAPTMKPCVKASSVDEKGVEPHAELQRREEGGALPENRAAKRSSQPGPASENRTAGGPSRSGSRGER